MRKINSILVLVPLLAGCASTGSGAPEPPVSATFEHVLDVEEVDFPIMTFSRSLEQRDVFERARGILDQHCLKHFGIKIAIPAVAPPPAGYTWTRYGLASYADAAVTGYRVPATPIPAHPTKPIPPEEDLDASEVANRVYLGQSAEFGGRKVPDGGCQMWSLRTLGWSIGVTREDIIEKLFLEAMHRSVSDSRVEGLITDWRSCMKDIGYEFETPMAAMQHWRSKGMRGKVTQEEISQAVADMKCKDQTKLLDTWVAVDLAYQHMLIDEHLPELQEIKAEYVEQERRALAVLGGDLPPVEVG